MPSCKNVLFPRPFVEPYNTFLKAGTYLWRNAHRTLYGELATDPAYPYTAFYNEFIDVQDNYLTLRKKNELDFPFNDGSEHFIQAIEIDNILGTMCILVQIDKSTEPAVNAEELTKKAVQDTERFSWLASVNRNVLWSMHPYPFKDDKLLLNRSIPVGDEAFSDFGDAYGEKDGRTIFHQGSLRNDSWKEPQSCPAIIPLRTPDEQTTVRTKEFFVLADAFVGSSVQEDTDHPEGTYRSFDALWIVSAHIARETLFAHRG